MSPIENLAAYGDLVRFTELAELIEPSMAARLRKLDGPACVRIAKRARKLREHVYDLLGAVHAGQPVPQADLDAITAAVQAAHKARALVTRRRGSLPAIAGPLPMAPDIPVHACALAVERLLVDVDRERIRKCGASDCAVYYVDTSKAQLRQWCSMKNCGNREKQRRWRSGPQ